MDDDDLDELGAHLRDEGFTSWRALTWSAWRELKTTMRRPTSKYELIGPLCWQYCRPDQASESAEWSDQCKSVGCMCPCHRWGSDEYKRQ